MSISRKVREQILRASWIRRMFEEGARLREVLGPERVFDFTLGNPMVEPPEGFEQVLVEVASETRPGLHRYMHNAGYPEVRAAVAAHLSEIHHVEFGANHVVMTVGAAGAMNTVLKAILDPGDEVLVMVPFFPEYAFYIDNHGGRVVEVQTDERFHLDLGRIQEAIGPKTRAVIVNTPNNPTGAVYDQESLEGLGRLLAQAELRYGRPVYLISDEPYRAVYYGEGELPSVFSVHPYAVSCTSHSKDLALPGERIGYAAINPDNPAAADLFGAMTFTNRILGYVNAPALMQRVVARLQGWRVEPELYRRRRDLLVTGLREAGLDIDPPDGAFYLFPKTPIPDDVAFVNMLKDRGILVVPGSGFGRPGHIRLSYCVDEETISRSVPVFAEAMADLRAKGLLG